MGSNRVPTSGRNLGSQNQGHKKLAEINKSMATITKKELVQKISQARGLHPNEVRNVIQSFLDEMTDCLARAIVWNFVILGYLRSLKENKKSAAILKMLQCLSSSLQDLL